MGKTSQAQRDSGEYAFTRAAYDELQDAQLAYDVEFLVQLQPTRSKGVWLLSVTVLNNAGGRDDGPVVSYSAAWPNSVAQSFGAFLYGSFHRACRMVEGWHRSKMESEG